MAEVIDELLKYEKGWTENMGDYWRERMERLRTIDTGALYASIKGHLEQGTVTTIEHTFLQYGIYVAAGVGPAHVWKSGQKRRAEKKSCVPMMATLTSSTSSIEQRGSWINPKKWVLPGVVVSLVACQKADVTGSRLNTMPLS